MAGKKRKAGPDWTAIKAEYLAGGISYRKLADKFGVNLSTLEKRAKRESWADQMRQVCGEVAAELPARIAEVVASKATDWAEQHAEGFNELWNLILGQARAVVTEATREVTSESGPQEIRVSALDKLLGLRRATSGLRDAQTGIRKALGLDKGEGKDDPTDPLDRLTQAIGKSIELMEAQPPPAEDEP